jgi:hypothetical protein
MPGPSPSQDCRKTATFCSVFASLCLLLSSHAYAADWQQGTGFRFQSLTPTPGGKPGFNQLSTSVTGIDFTNTLMQSRHLTNQIYLNGSGVAAGDVDGDGRCDLYFCGLDRPNALFRNLGNWHFQNITAEAGVACAGLDSTGAAFADIDGDGDLDLIVNTVGHGTHIFLNDGKGHFTEAPGSPINLKRGGMSLALADIDGNGTLDLYVANYRTDTVRDMPRARIQGQYINGVPTIVSFNDRPVSDPDLAGRFTLDRDGKLSEHGEVDALFLNDGKGRFSPVPFTDGRFLDEDGRPLTAPPHGWGLSVMLRDLNGDGYPDLYVCNDFESPDRIWLNNGKGQFRALPRLALRHTSRFSMGVDVADVNRDGYDDIFVADMLSREHFRRQVQVGGLVGYFSQPGVLDDRPQYLQNTLQVNRGDGTYAEIAWFAGVPASEWSWMPIFLDVDLDGYEDLLISNGAERDGMYGDVIQKGERMKRDSNITERELLDAHRLFPRLATPNVAFRNRGNLTFEDVSAAWGLDGPSVSQGMALADLDNDGDLDLVINNMNGPAGIYRNNSSAPRVAVRLKGLPPNTRGIGARLTLHGGAVPLQSQEMICGGRYLSADENMRVFAAGSLTNRMDLEVRWRSGKRSMIRDVTANCLYEVDERSATDNAATLGLSSSEASVSVPEEQLPAKAGAPAAAPRNAATSGQQWFEDVSRLLGHQHHQESFDDFARQPLLPNKLSQSGPGVAWDDVDQDGWDDLVIAGGQGGQLAIYRNDQHGGFKPLTNAPLARTLTRGQTSVVGLQGVLVAGSSNYEDGLTNGGAIRIYDLLHNAGGESVLGQASTTGPLALADVDNDGYLDLFIGGRVVPGRYSEPATSLLLRNTGGRFVPMQRFEKLGLVSGAVFSDLDGDGTPELILACEWGPLRVFRYVSGRFDEITGQLGLDRYTGWWNGVTTGDFDGDGKPDIIASNWGLNSHYQASRQQPRHLYFGDLAGGGGMDLVECYWDAKLGRDLPDRNLRAVGAALPFVYERAPTFESYAHGTVSDIYGPRLENAVRLEVNTLATMVFLNRGDHFEPVVLPMEAQWSTGFGVCVGDFDGDGNEDVFLSQNFFAVNADGTRQDAGRGLWLKGDGTGRFTSVPGQQSGVLAYGEQRGCALSDYDGDGRVDLVVGQNGAETKLFHNVGAKPGLRVRLKGPGSNPRAIGAAMRLVYGEKFGPLRELHAGSGYWSQDSAVQVLGKAGEPSAIWVRWPGGKVTQSPLPSGAATVEVDTSGKIESSH